MQFKIHVLGGLLAGTAVVTLSQISGFTSATRTDLLGYLKNPYDYSGDIPVLCGLFTVTLFMSLFPDLDSASVLQRWFYRVIFLILLFLFFTGQTGLFAAVTFIALLPLLHRHRGWTHSKLTPLVLSLLFAAIVEFNRSRTGGFSTGSLLEWFNTYWLYVIACLAGHYTHLLLDRQL